MVKLLGSFEGGGAGVGFLCFIVRKSNSPMLAIKNETNLFTQLTPQYTSKQLIQTVK